MYLYTIFYLLYSYNTEEIELAGSTYNYLKKKITAYINMYQLTVKKNPNELYKIT